jgi:hypothetical protein
MTKHDTTKHEKIGEAGAASYTYGSHDLNADHMVMTNGVIPPGSVPPPDAERTKPRKVKKEKP